MTDAPSLAVKQRHVSRRQEWNEQTKLAELLPKYFDRSSTFLTIGEQAALAGERHVSEAAGHQGRLPDAHFLYRGKSIYVELKSRRGSKAQKQVRAELLQAGADWWLVQPARGDDGAAPLGVPFRRRWKLPRLKPWEGPFADPNQRLRQAPGVAAQRRAARRRALASAHP
jgi:hypothetical protein